MCSEHYYEYMNAFSPRDNKYQKPSEKMPTTLVRLYSGRVSNSLTQCLKIFFKERAVTYLPDRLVGHKRSE